MASIIRIKRSSVSGNPSTLAAGELAYSALTDNGSNGGDRLYIGIGTETGGNAANHFVIGGKFFTDMLDHTKGTLTASSALVADADSKLDNLKVDNIDLNGNTISTTDANGDLILNPNGTGLVSIASAYTLPRADGLEGQVLVTNGDGTVSFQTPASSSLTLSDGTNQDVFNTGETLTFTGGTGLTSTVANNSVTFDLDDTSVNAGSYGSATDIVGFTVDAQGRLTAVSTYTPEISFTDDSNTTESLSSVTFAGAGGLSTNISGSTLTVTLDDANNDVGSFGSDAEVPVITVNSKGQITAVTTASISTSFTLAADTGTSSTFNNGSTLTISGGEGIDTSVSGDTITITGEDATTTNKGIASFSSNSFDVTSGAVTIKTAGVTNTQLVNSNVTVGTTTIDLGGSSTSLTGLTQVDIDNITINGNEISSTDNDGNISLNPNGNGTVAFNSSRATGLADPVDAQDAATKAYVDAVKTGLDVKDSVRVATTGPITGSNTQTIDGVSLSVGDRVLVKNQADATENGVYVVANGTWSRAADFDNDPGVEVTSGAFMFVEEGTVNGDSGWVLTTNGTITIGTSELTFAQFSGAGQITAGQALTKTGNTLDVNVAATGGIEISADALQLKSTVAGDGLTYADGVIDVVGTADRISVSANAVDIASTYVGQNSITTLGTVTTGTWNADTVTVAYGGTGATSLTSNGILYGNGTGAIQATAAGTDGYILYSNNGTPAWTNQIDGGTY